MSPDASQSDTIEPRPWTVSQLRVALEGVPAEARVRVR